MDDLWSFLIPRTGVGPWPLMFAGVGWFALAGGAAWLLRWIAGHISRLKPWGNNPNKTDPLVLEMVLAVRLAVGALAAAAILMGLAQWVRALLAMF